MVILYSNIYKSKFYIYIYIYKSEEEFIKRFFFLEIIFIVSILLMILNFRFTRISFA